MIFGLTIDGLQPAVGRSSLQLGKLDLNLLVVPDALLRERSVSLARERVGLSQSTVFGALGRLRDYFGDELVIMKGR